MVNLQGKLIFAGWFCFEYDAEAARKKTATNVQPRPVAADADVATQVPAACQGQPTADGQPNVRLCVPCSLCARATTQECQHGKWYKAVLFVKVKKIILKNT